MQMRLRLGKVVQADRHWGWAKVAQADMLLRPGKLAQADRH
jgi:hypothetical protein